jgi:hypothetical protein
MKHYVKLQSAEDLKLEWFDPAIPHMSARFNEQTLEECQIINGSIYATYEPMIFDEPCSWNTMDGVVSVPAGMYFVHPDYEIL